MLDARARARFARSRSGVTGAVIVAGLLLASMLGPLVAQHGPYESDFAHAVTPDLLPVGPGPGYPLGADRLFRDELARLAWAGRLSLAIALASTLLATAIGSAVGIAAGTLEGARVRVPWPAVAGAAAGATTALLGHPWVGLAAAVAGAALALGRRWTGPRLDVDGLLMRAVDVMLAFPFLLLVMAIGAALERTSALTILLTLGVTGWLGIARIVRAKTMQVRSLDYVLASRALGQPTVRRLLKHVLPSVAGPIIVTSTMQVAQMIVADGVLSFLGVGISPPTPTWGSMLLEGKDAYAVAPWLVAGPGAAIVLAVWGFNLLGEGLRDALDPREV